MLVNNFMSKVANLNEKEKEETILFLAEALVNDNYEFLKKISPKVQNIVLPFLTDINVKSVKEAVDTLNILKGDEQNEIRRKFKAN